MHVLLPCVLELIWLPCCGDPVSCLVSSRCWSYLLHSLRRVHTCTVILPGRSFLQRAIALLGMAKQPFHHICLNNEFQADLLWWKTFAMHWNGTALILSPQPATFYCSHFRRLRHMGMWSLVRSAMVPTQVGQLLLGETDCSEGAHPSGDCRSYLGPPVVWQMSAVQLR